jgi:hypothetical protein
MAAPARSTKCRCPPQANNVNAIGSWARMEFNPTEKKPLKYARTHKDTDNFFVNHVRT